MIEQISRCVGKYIYSENIKITNTIEKRPKKLPKGFSWDLIFFLLYNM